MDAKVVFSAKLIRKFVHLDEGDVSCIFLTTSFFLILDALKFSMSQHHAIFSYSFLYLIYYRSRGFPCCTYLKKNIMLWLKLL
jgi:hypothetical protein